MTANLSEAYRSDRGRAYRNLMVCAINAGLSAGRSIGFGELSVHAALDPTPDADKWIVTGNADALSGSAFGTTWLERKGGAFLQTATQGFYCKDAAKAFLVNVAVAPYGYDDRGKIMM